MVVDAKVGRSATMSSADEWQWRRRTRDGRRTGGPVRALLQRRVHPEQHSSSLASSLARTTITQTIVIHLVSLLSSAQHLPYDFNCITPRRPSLAASDCAPQ